MVRTSWCGIATSRCLIVIIAFALSGCGSEDDGGGPLRPPTPTYPERSTPQNVLSALEIAYSSRDTVMYQNLYDSSYVGTSTDLTFPGNDLTLTWYDEAAHIRALKTTPGINAYLDFGPPSTWTRMASDDVSHPEWTVIQISGSAFTIRIDDTIAGSTLEASGEPGDYQSFAFEPTLDSTSPTDTLWRIRAWREVGQSGPGVP